MLMHKRRLDEWTRITLFLRAFKIKVGDKICKRCEIDLENSDTLVDKWEEIKQTALEWSEDEGSQMTQFFREEEDESFEEAAAPPLKILKNEGKQREVKKDTSKKVEKSDPMDEIVSQLKDLKIQQLESQRNTKEEAVKR